MARHVEVEQNPIAPEPPSRFEEFFKLVAVQMIVATVVLAWLGLPLMLAGVLLPGAVWLAFKHDRRKHRREQRRPLLTDDDE